MGLKSYHSSTTSLNRSRSSSINDEDVRIVGMHDLHLAAASLAESFVDDHTAHYFLDPALPIDHPKNAALHLQLMTAMTAQHVLDGIVTATGPPSDPYACIALWCPPGTHTDSRISLIRSGLWRMHYKLSREARARLFTEFFPLLTNTKRSVLGHRDSRSWYLVYLGTRSSARGRGLARRTVAWATRHADQQGVPCYLESSNEVNPPIYERWGFSKVCTIALDRDATIGPIKMDIMVRESQSIGDIECERCDSSIDGLSLIASTDSEMAQDDGNTGDDYVKHTGSKRFSPTITSKKLFARVLAPVLKQKTVKPSRLDNQSIFVN